MPHIPRDKIGGAIALRRTTLFNIDYVRGDKIDVEVVRQIPEVTRKALVENQFIEVFQTSGDLLPDAKRIVVHRGGGVYDVYRAVKISDRDLTKDEASALAAQADS